MNQAKYANQRLYKLLTISLACLFFFNPVVMKADYHIKESVQSSVPSFSKISAPDWYEKPSSYQELVEWYKELETIFPNQVEVFKANEWYNTGKVEGGYDLYYVRLTNETLGFDKPEVLFLGSPHGDETVGTIGLYWFTHWILRKAYTNEPCPNYSKDWLRWLINNREIYIVISQNPSGFDRVQRHDEHGWDLNREADYDGPGTPTGGIWGSVNGKTLRAFIDNHTIRVGCDFHGGARMLLYPWSSTHEEITAVSILSGKEYTHVPPDFHFFDVTAHRIGNFMGNYGGRIDEDSIGTVPDTVGYEARGAIGPWAYGADVEKHPAEDDFINDEIFGNYPGTGILWFSPEMSKTKNPKEQSFGNDTLHRYGAEVRRFVLHQTDLAQPYVRWMETVPLNNTILYKNESITFQWQVNGSLVVENTSIQLSWKEGINESNWSSVNLVTHGNTYSGGTGWDFANNGQTTGVTYQKTLVFDRSGDYYISAKAMVDQIYQNTIAPKEYGHSSYLRLLNERVNESYIEINNGTDGIETIRGTRWWFSPPIHITVLDDELPSITIDNPENAVYVKNNKIFEVPFINKPIIFGNINISVDVSLNNSIIKNISFYVNNNLAHVDAAEPYYFMLDDPCFGLCTITVVARCEYDETLTKTITIWKFF